MKRYLFEFTTQSFKEFLSLPRNIQTRIKTKLTFFISEKNPLQFAKKLVHLNNRFRFRIGDYRIIVTPKERGIFLILLIVKIGHRRDVYE